MRSRFTYQPLSSLLLSLFAASACSSDGGNTSGSASSTSGSSDSSSTTSSSGMGGMNSSSTSGGIGGSMTGTGGTTSGTGAGGMGTGGVGTGGAGIGGAGAGGVGAGGTTGSASTGTGGGGNAVCQNVPNGTACNDGNACTQTDSCQAGVCVGGSSLICSPKDQCHTATCDSGTGNCVNSAVPDGLACNDNDACTLNDTCQLGYCVAESAVQCAASGMCHAAGGCDPLTGQCSNPLAIDGSACSDGNATTANDVCVVGICKGYSPITVTITSPAEGTIVGANMVQVTGTISEPAAVKLGTVQATVVGQNFSATVPVEEGSNFITAEAKGAGDNIGADATTVLRDTTPPRVAVLSPNNFALLPVGTTTVTGIVHDLLLGTVNSSDCTVTVNGVQALVENRGFRAVGVPILEGERTITVIAKDSAGNTASTVLSVKGDARSNSRIVPNSGSAQTGIVGTPLGQPFTAIVTDNAGNPVSGVPVTFNVTRGNGTLGNGARSQTVNSDAGGMTSAMLTLGNKAGAATDQVTATAEGFLGSAVFFADAQADMAGPRVLAAVLGGNQRGFVSSLAPQPLVVLLSDENGNPIAGQNVTYTVQQGGGLVNGQTSMTVQTDADGRAYVLHTLGPAEGPGSQLVEVTSVGAFSAHFATSTFQPGLPANTKVSGVVLSNENAPVANVLISIKSTNLSAVTNAEGRFEIQGAPIGHIHVDIDGTLAGPYPPLRSFELDLLTGVDNVLERPVYLPLVDSDGVVMANDTTDVAIRRADTPGLEMVISAGSATFKNMSKTGVVQIIRVHQDKIPMLPADGTIPSIAFAIMPADVHFDPPAPIRFPNVDGRKPGEIVTIYSFDHDLYEFVAVGTATVSEDGQEVISEPGQGIVKGGWHYTPPVVNITSCTVSTKCRIKRCDGMTGTCVWQQQITLGGVMWPTVSNAAPLVTPGSPWVPDSDCYNTANGCLGGSASTVIPCTITSVLNRNCVRGYNGSGDPLNNASGTCQVPQFGNPNGLAVCCPGGVWNALNPNGHFCPNPVGCPDAGGQSICCANVCTSNGCCP